MSEEVQTRKYHPANQKAEVALCGALLINPDHCVDMPAGLVKGAFYVPTHGEVFDAIMTVWKSGTDVNDITVGQELDKRGIRGEVEKEGRTGQAKIPAHRKNRVQPY